MKQNHRPISDYVGVAPRFLRSIHLADDWQRAEASEGYVLTPNIVQALSRLVTGLTAKGGQRAFTLIGPYGSGKSAFAVFLCRLLGSDRGASAHAMQHLANRDGSLAAECQTLLSVGKKGKGKTAGRGFFPITVTARRRPITQVLLEGLLQNAQRLARTPGLDALLDRIRKTVDTEPWADSAMVLRFLEELGDEAKKQGYTGLLVLVDEAGKTLEYALQDPAGGDVHVFQELAEFAARQQELPILFLTLLHQMFDDYVELANRTIRAEWTKVQERFQTIQFAESAAATMQMLGEALQHATTLPPFVVTAIDDAVARLERLEVPLPVGLDPATFRQLARRVWPLHPTTLLSVPYLFRRLAQNERSVFSYLTSNEPCGFQEHLKEECSPDDAGFVYLSDLYTYLLSNYEAGLARHPHAKRLLEANETLNSHLNLSVGHWNTVKTVAMLNVLGEISPLRATEKFLECAVGDGCSDLESSLADLKRRSILSYRQLDSSYRTWEGSDVDIEARLKEARRHMQTAGDSFLEILRRHLPERNLVARRHSLRTGALRHFSLEYAGRLEKPEAYTALGMANGASGRIVVLLPQSDPASMKALAERVTAETLALIVALPRQIEALRVVVEELACLRWVADNTEELRDDRVARRELNLRTVECEQTVGQFLQTLFDPRPAPTGNACQWFWNGRDQGVQTPADVSRLLSRACDETYKLSPCLRNELIARRSISSAAAAARRNLLAKMLESAQLERLGIEGFPPERSMYESALNAAGLHVKDAQAGQWRFQAPPAGNPVNLRPCWDLLERAIFTDSAKRVELKDVFAQLAAPPYGLPDGVHPILFTAFHLVNGDDLFLYRENSFIPDPQLAHFELLLRRPDLFSVSGARLDGIRRTVVERIARGLKVLPKTATVVRSLFRGINSLPTVTLKTVRITDKMALQMREVFVNARSPEQLLFVDLPHCFGVEPFLAGQSRDDDVERFFKALNICIANLREYADALRAKNRDVVLKKCSLSAGSDGWLELERRAQWLAPRQNTEALTPFLGCVNNSVADGHNPTATLSCIAGRPFEMWTDMDVDRFPGLADGICELFVRAWRQFGDDTPTLSADELREKNELRSKLSPRISELRKHGSSAAALRAALMDLLRELEGEA